MLVNEKKKNKGRRRGKAGVSDNVIGRREQQHMRVILKMGMDQGINQAYQKQYHNFFICRVKALHAHIRFVGKENNNRDKQQK